MNAHGSNGFKEPADDRSKLLLIYGLAALSAAVVMFSMIYILVVGITNDIIWLEDGQETLDFLYGTGGNGGNGHRRDVNKDYVLLLDIRMPKVDGIKILKRIKADDELKNIPVIMVTTSDAQANIDICTRLGCSDYLVKPLDGTLVKTVQEVCRHI